MQYAEMQADVRHSQAIEEITYDETSASAQAHLAAVNHAWEQAANGVWPDVQELHSILMQPSDLQLPEIGQWRTIGCYVGTEGCLESERHMPKANALPELMKGWEYLCKEYVETASSLTASDRQLGADVLYYHLLCIHPFADGNGRTGRLMRSSLRVLAGLPWDTITADVHPKYLSALSSYEDQVFRQRYTKLY